MSEAGHVVDTPETRAIVNAYMQRDGGLDLPAAHVQLQRLLGSQYDAVLWGKLLDAVVSSRESTPMMTQDEAFQFFGNESSVGDAEDGNSSDFRQINLGFF